MNGLCQCGCGRPTPIAKRTYTAKGHVKGQPVRFIVGHNQRAVTPASGYRQRYVPDLRRASASGVVQEHVLIAERAVGHVLPDGVEVHHVDGNGLNNANTNLVVCQDKAYHKLLHVRARVLSVGGDPNTQRICSTCKALKLFGEFYFANTPGGLQQRCKACGKTHDKGRWRGGAKGRAA